MTKVNSFKNGVLGTLISDETSTLHNTIIVQLRMAMHLALRRPVLDQLLRIQLAPMHLDAGKGPASTLDANGSLDHVKLWTGIHHLLDQAKVASGQELTRPHPDHETFHSQFAALWSSANCFSWSLRGIGCSTPACWDQNNFSVELPS